MGRSCIRLSPVMAVNPSPLEEWGGGASMPMVGAGWAEGDGAAAFLTLPGGGSVPHENKNPRSSYTNLVVRAAQWGFGRGCSVLITSLFNCCRCVKDSDSAQMEPQGGIAVLEGSAPAPAWLRSGPNCPTLYTIKFNVHLEVAASSPHQPLEEGRLVASVTLSVGNWISGGSVSGASVQGERLGSHSVGMETVTCLTMVQTVVMKRAAVPALPR